MVFVACNENATSEVSGGYFTVHFENPEDKELAVEIVNFWKQEDLMTSKKQDVKLVRSKGGYALYLIAPGRKSAEEMSFEEIQALIILQEELNKTIFKDTGVNIVICNEMFKPLFEPNL